MDSLLRVCWVVESVYALEVLVAMIYHLGGPSLGYSSTKFRNTEAVAQLSLQAYACVFFVIFTGKGSGQKTRAMSKNDSQIVQAQYNAGLV